MQVCTLDGQPYLVGLEWNSMLLQGTPSRLKEQERRALKALGPAASVTLRKGGYVVIGHAPKSRLKALGKGALKHPSATALLALIAPEGSRWIVRQTLEDGQVWLGVLVDGVPYTGADLVITAQAADQFIGALQAVDSYQVYDNRLNELLSKIDKKRLHQALVAVRGEQTVKVLLALVALSVVLAGSAVGYDYFKNSERAKRLQAQLASDAEASSQETQRQAQQRREQRQQELASKLRKITAQEQVGLWRAALNPQHLSVKGWGLRTVACNVSACTLTYLRTKGLLKRFLSQYPNARFELRQPNEVIVTVDIKQVPTALTGRELTGEFTQEMRTTMGNLMHMSSNAEIQFVPTDMQIDAIAPVVFGSWKASGPRYDDVRDLAELFDKNSMSPNFVIQSLSLKVADSHLERWELGGEYVFLKDSK